VLSHLEDIPANPFAKSNLITAPITFAPNGAVRPALFRKIFELSRKVQKARLYITAQGVYEAHINGHRVSDHILAPGWTSYKHHLNYQTFDVTSLMQSKEQVLAVEVGEGWFCTRLGFNGGKRCHYGDRLALLAQLEVIFEDGEILIINSDDSWKTSVGPIISSEIYDGEVYDAFLMAKGWNKSSFDDSGWMGVEQLDFPTAKLVAPKGPPVRKIETLKAKRVLKSPKGKTIVDFGQNIVGWVHVRVSGSKGDKIVLTHTEGTQVHLRVYNPQ